MNVTIRKYGWKRCRIFYSSGEWIEYVNDRYKYIRLQRHTSANKVYLEPIFDEKFDCTKYLETPEYKELYRLNNYPRIKLTNEDLARLDLAIEKFNNIIKEELSCQIGV